MKRQKNQTGITLPELLTTVSVLALLLTLSAPSFSGFINKREVAGAANLISAFLDNIKMESIKRNRFVAITYMESENGIDWCFGAKVRPDKDAEDNQHECDCLASAETTNCRLDAGGPPVVFSNSSYSKFEGLQITSALSDKYHVDIDPVRGVLKHAEKVDIQVKDSAQEYLVNISLGPTGRVSKCTPSEYHLVGYPACT